MKLRQAEFALAVAQTLSFRRAAELCHVTQPTLSTGVAQLEEELGGKLFKRSTRHVALTPMGRHVLPFLHAVVNARDEAVSAAKAFLNPERKLLRIGMSPLVDMSLVSLVTDAFMAAAPGTELFFKECLLDDLQERLTKGAIDVAVLPQDVVPEGLDRMAFYTDPMRYLPKHGAGSGAGALRLADLPQDPIIVTHGGCGLNKTLETAFEAEGVEAQYYPGRAISYPIIQEWAWLGLGAAVLPSAKLDDPASRPLLRRDGSTAAFAFSWVWQREARKMSHINAFLDHAKGQGARLVAGRAPPLVVQPGN